MKDIYKNPILYYILVPILVALWPLFVRMVYLPNAEAKWQSEKADYDKAQEIIGEIRELDPDRLEFGESKDATGEFDYANVVHRVASSCKIPSTNYDFSSRPATTSKGQKTKNCHVELKQVDITRFAKFLSTIQLRWANLQCEDVTLSKKPGQPDMWDVDIEFKYYY